MAIFLDFVGLNTLIREPISSSVNTIGYLTSSSTGDLIPYLELQQLGPEKGLRCAESSDVTTKGLGSLVDPGTTFPTSGYLSINFWLKLDVVDNDEKYIIEAIESSPFGIAFHISIYERNKLQVRLYNSSNQNTAWVSTPLPEQLLKKWGHFIISWDVGAIEESPKFYYNNIDAGELQPLASIKTGANRQVLESIHVMADNFSTPIRELKGTMLDLAFWNVDLITAEKDGDLIRNEVFERGMLEFQEPDGVIAYWSMGMEDELSNLTVGTKYISGDLLGVGLELQATVGTMILTASNNVELVEGFWPEYNVQAQYFPVVNSKFTAGNAYYTIYYADYLTALNTHRNGPYGFSSFKQTRVSQNPLTRYHNKNSIFSYVRDGLSLETNGRETFIPKRTEIRQITESPIISNNKPLTMVGGVSEYNRRTGKTTIERVEIQSSPTNEIQFFGDEQTNREFGIELETDDAYEDLTDLYLDGGIESDDSPIDQFELLRYQHQVYPREGNTYLGHVRGRENFISGYWRDSRTDRTQTSSSVKDLQNGFGFSVPSQSMWPLDVEEGWETRDLQSEIGSMTMSAPTELTWDFDKTVADGILLDPDLALGSGDEIYLYMYSPDLNATDVSSTYLPTAPGGAFGIVTGGRYRLNSSRGINRFYDAWISLMEDVEFRIESQNRNIEVRDNLDITDVTFVSNDPYYLEIDNAAGSAHFTTELSHSLVHWWTKDEDSAEGVVYRETDAAGINKRLITVSGLGQYTISQTTIFDYFNEEGGNSILTGSTPEGGVYRKVHDATSVDQYEGNEWNNKIVSFGDPATDGSDSVSLYSNSTKVTPDTVIDRLNFFDPDGNMNTNYVPFEKTSEVGLETKAYRKFYFSSFTIPILSHTTNNVFDFTLSPSGGQFGCSFYFKMDRNDFESSGADSFDFQLFRLSNSPDDGTEMYVRIYTDTTGFPIYAKAVFMDIYVEDSAGDISRSTYNITSHWNKMTKYMIVDSSSTTYPLLYTYVLEDQEMDVPTRFAESGSGTQNLWETDTMDTLSVYEQPSLLSPNNSQDGVIIADLLFLTGALGVSYNIADVINDGATVDYTASYWTGAEPLGWWRFNVDDEDPSPSTWISGTPPLYVTDRTSNNLDLGAIGNIGFTNDEGPPRQKAKPLGFQTGSIGEVFVLCNTSSTNNNSDDYFQNAKVAEFAIIPSQSNTDITEYISQPFYQFSDLTASSLTTTASIWYSFVDGGDSIAAGGASIINQNPSYTQFELVGNYVSATSFPSIENDGLVITGSTSNEIEFKVSNSDMLYNTSSLGAASTGILNYVSSSITGDFTNLYIGGATGYNSQLGPGILMNSYNAFNLEEIPAANTTELDAYLSASCLYTRRHTLMTGSSFQHPFVSLNYSSFFRNSNIRNFESFELYQGMAKWDAAQQSGKKPFYDEYGKYSAEMRLTNKDFTVVPEFRISQHVDKFLLKGDTEFDDSDNPLLEVTGGHESMWNSNLDGFYQTYSTTDFLKMFDLVQEEHDDFVNPISLKLKCKGVKKFLPYKGFYPADRTVEISQQFYDSYGEYLSITSSYSTASNNYAVQNLLTPLFSPGILFNTIKSGVACDYPIMTGDFATSSVEDPLASELYISGTHVINEQFHKRIPFEALIEPEKYLANQPLYPQEPDPLGDLDMTVTWNGGGDEKYRLMVSNFLAETGEFFLRNKDFASISSLPEGDPNFGNAEAGKTYAMRIKMYRTISGDKALWELDDETYTYTGDTPPIPQGTFSVPQDTGSMEQAFMMYSRPSAFGPPQRITIEGQHNDEYSFNFTTWADYKKGTGLDYFYTVYEDVVSIVGTTTDPAVVPDGFDDLRAKEGVHYLVANDAYAGYNYPFTPPYYHGEAWADVLFRSQNTEKLSLSQIINSSSVEFLRFYEATPTPEQNSIPLHFHNSWRLINEDAMQIASSVNIFSKGVLKQDITQTKRQGIRNDVQVQVDTNVGNQYRWIIQSKFETPILNFKKYTHNTDSVTIPSNSSQTTPIGMWHQYGELPQNPNEGVFMQVTEIPDQWIDNAMNANSYQTGSLVELCGFSTDPVRLGDVAPTKTIKEAVVAIPFIEKFGQKQFFTIDREDIQNALEPSTNNLVGKTIQDMVKRMKDYVFPPSMDFINNDDIDPFAMYIFEFKHTLDKQDLADIWQNLSPSIGEYHEEAEAVVSHELLSHELLGGKADLKPGRNAQFELNRQVRKDKIDSKIRWMIFKVKQRAKTNYFEKIFARNESQEAGAKLKKTTLSSTGASKNASYNWPYDYFSLVELIKMEAEVDFARPDDENQEEKMVIKPYTKPLTNSVNQTILNNALFGTELPEPEQSEQKPQEKIPKGKKRRRKRRQKRRERRNNRRNNRR